MDSLHCTTCNLHFKSKACLTKHFKTNRHIHRSSMDVQTHSCVCGKSYLYNQSLYVHRKKCTTHLQNLQEKKDSEGMQTQIRILQEEKELLRKQVEELFNKFEQLNPTPVVPPLVQNTTNNNNCIENQTNNSVHVHINSFGNENLDYISNDFIHGCVNRIYESVPTIVEKMHFDPAHPENHNFKIPNKKLPHASVMSEDQKWKLMDRQEAINNMIDKGYNIIDSQFREDPSKFSESKRRHYRRFQENYDTEDKDTMKRIRSDVELVVLNGTREIHK